MAFFATYLFPSAIAIQTLRTKPSLQLLWLFWITFFSPLQGFFNFMVFIFPRVTGTKRTDKNLLWCQAVWVALKSWGDAKSKQNQRWRQMNISRISLDEGWKRSRGRGKTVKKRIPDEEEKCEVVRESMSHFPNSPSNYWSALPSSQQLLNYMTKSSLISWVAEPTQPHSMFLS